MNIRNHRIAAQAGGKRKSPLLQGGSPVLRGLAAPAQSSSVPGIRQPPGLARREICLWVSYFFFFFAAFFFIRLFRIDFDFLPALRACFLRPTGIDTSSQPVTAG